MRIVDVASDERHFRLRATAVPFVATFHATTCTSRHDADNLWLQACRLENSLGMLMFNGFGVVSLL